MLHLHIYNRQGLCLHYYRIVVLILSELNHAVKCRQDPVRVDQSAATKVEPWHAGWLEGHLPWDRGVGSLDAGDGKLVLIISSEQRVANRTRNKCCRCEHPIKLQLKNFAVF